MNTRQRKLALTPLLAFIGLGVATAAEQAPFADLAPAPDGLGIIPQAQPRSAAFPALFQDNVVVTPALDVEKLKQEDAQLDGIGPLRMGVVQDFTAPAGRWTPFSDGSWIWTLAIKATGAQAVRVQISNWTPPLGTELVVYNPLNPAFALGPLTRAYQPQGGPLWTPTVYAETVYIEYYVPPGFDHTLPAAQLQVDGVLNQYRALPFEGSPLDELPCHLDVTCYPTWAAASKGVGAVSYVSNHLGFFCTGAMLNRNPTDFTPLFMTAAHCGINAGNASTVLATWFYQTSACNGAPPDPNTLPQTQGVVLLAKDVGLDWTFIGMSSHNTGGVTFEGWDSSYFANNSAATSISHPAGSYKRIAFGTKVGDDGSTPDPNNPPNCMGSNHTHVQFAQGNGRIEPGSSGSPVFDGSQRVRATLSCGSNFTCTGTEDADYGRLDQMYPELAPWLAPTDPIYVNWAYPGTEQGTLAQPFRTVIRGEFAVQAGHNVYIQSGDYNEQMVIHKAMTLHALNGVATIGH